MKTKASNLKKGEFIETDNTIWLVKKAKFYVAGRGSAVVKTRLENIKSGKVKDKTFRSNKEVELADIDTVESVFLYKDKDFIYLMDKKNYNQYKLKIEYLGSISKYLKEGQKLHLLLGEGRPQNIRPPQTVKLKVIKAQEAVKGDTATSAKKKVTVETGEKIVVPLFVKKDDVIVINPKKGEYVERVAKSS